MGSARIETGGFRTPAVVRRTWESQQYRVLNLGCGHKTSSNPAVLNVDWAPYLRLRSHRTTHWLALRLLRGRRRQQYQDLPTNVLAADLSKGLPFEDGSIDVVYHSHMLEHLPREVAPAFFRDVWRVLRPGGHHRIVVPDLSILADRYMSSYGAASRGGSDPQHERAIEDLLEQSIRKVPAGLATLPAWQRRVAMALFGDARQRGEVHLWMYDSASLARLLEQTGFAAVTRGGFDSSAIPEWPGIGLDYWSTREAPPDSLYMEARRPV
jgi:SAM-dependent methyltransferase